MFSQDTIRFIWLITSWQMDHILPSITQTQNDITSSSVQKHRDGNKWMEYRKKGDNIHQCDRQQSQQTIKLPNVRRERHHNEEENQGARWKPSQNVNMELPPTGTGSRGKTIKTFANNLHYFHYLVHTQQILTACFFHLLQEQQSGNETENLDVCLKET